MPTMREKMARAMYDADRVVNMASIEEIWATLLADKSRAKHHPKDRRDLDAMRAETYETSEQQQHYLRRADAALDALMEPTDGMIAAAVAQCYDFGDLPTGPYKTMIRAAREGK